MHSWGRTSTPPDQVKEILGGKNQALVNTLTSNSRETEQSLAAYFALCSSFLLSLSLFRSRSI